MPAYKFTLRLITPAFAGAVPSGETRTIRYLTRSGLQTAEAPYHPVDPAGIRVPSLRGVLEFWLRSLAGGEEPKDVFSRQGEVFGSTQLGQGLRIRPAGRPRFESGELGFTGRDWVKFLYLGYGPLQFRKDPSGNQVATTYHKKECRDAILVRGTNPPEFRFVANGSDEQIAQLKRALTLLHLFGGIGGRSRRGWGAVEVEAPCIPYRKAGEESVAWIRRALAKTLAEKGQGRITLPPRPRFSAFGSGTEIRVTRPTSGDSSKVLLDFYRRFAEVRLYRPRTTPTAQADHALEFADANGPAITGVPQRLAYGMPYFPQGSRRNPDGTPEWSIEYVRTDLAGSKTTGRRASPLFLKVHRDGKNRHFGVALFLDADFFADRDARIGATKQTGAQPPPDDYAAVHEFLNSPDWVAVDPNQLGEPTP